tara:strand:- start:606 stop:845 length:240 start_codon:yes stop_codon:yes gene_type:complete
MVCLGKADRQHQVTTENKLVVKCWACKDGWHWEPDGYGCGQWTLCARCGGESYLKESDNEETETEYQRTERLAKALERT